jgi:hypothetical protein
MSGRQSGALVPPDPVLLRILLSGLALSVVGFFLPWYYVSYTPPNGSVRVAGQLLTGFSYSYSGVSPERAGLLDFNVAGHSFGEQVISGAAMTGVIRVAQAASYLHINLGDGFWLVLIGLLIVIGAIAKRFFATLVILVVGVVVLAFVHSAWILSFVHQLGF